jgi:hypothetical protein
MVSQSHGRRGRIPDGLKGIYAMERTMIPEQKEGRGI